MTSLTPFIEGMIAYLDPAFEAAHRDEILAELRRRVTAEPFSPPLLQILLSSPRHIPLDVVEAYLDANGIDISAPIRNWDNTETSAVEDVDFAGFAPEERLRLLARLKGARWRREDIDRAILDSLADSDTAFLDALSRDGIRSNDRIIETALAGHVIDQAGPGAASGLRHLLAGVTDMTRRDEILAQALRDETVKAVAACLASGWTARGALARLGPVRFSNGALNRFFERGLSSRHRELTMQSWLPSVEEILSLPIKQLNARLGPKPETKPGRSRREEGRQHFISNGLPIPDRLKD